MDYEKKNPAYELLFIVSVAESIEAAQATVSKFVTLVESNGEIIDKSEWGKRHLEYPINDMKEGYYTVVTFRSEPAFPAELERLLGIDENVMRSLVLRLDEEVAEKAARRALDKAAAAEAEKAEAEKAEAEKAEAEADAEPAEGTASEVTASASPAEEISPTDAE